ncbi:MAG: hypothetical protein LUD72_09980 [Bacteroidales bacterium]|nr:hypothetical protein [Bacteroidales bacterium]
MAGRRINRQGNPIDECGKLVVEKISCIDELTDGDFTEPTRSVELPKLPDNVDRAIGANGKPVVIKRNIFGRNKGRHVDLTPEQSRDILQIALYNPDLYGRSQPKTKPYNWVLIRTIGAGGKNRLVLLEVSHNKDNVEIVHWHYVNNKNLKLIKNQAKREDGQLLILPSAFAEEVGGLSDPTNDLVFGGKDSDNSEISKGNE